MPRNPHSKRLYFDYAASTPVDPTAARAMRPYFSEKFGNPGSLHSFGQEAIAAVDRAREIVAASLGAGFREIIFTSSATEANNLTLYSAYFRFKEQYPAMTPKLIVSAVEHESVLEAARFLQSRGAALSVIPVDTHGVVDMKRLKAELDESVCIVSVMYVNNEAGTVEPVAEISEIIRDFRESRIVNNESRKDSRSIHGSRFMVHGSSFPLFHTDAAQAFQFFDCNVKDLGVDMLTLSSQKIYGPKGAGALYVRQASGIKYQDAGMTRDAGRLTPMIHGGGQEFGARSGTENVPAIVGFAAAAELLLSNSHELDNKRIRELKNYFWREVKKISPKAAVNGPAGASGAPHIINIFFPNHTSEDILTRLDLAGIAASAGSACSARSLQPSYVLQAMGCNAKRASSSVRFSFGRLTTKDEIRVLLRALKTILD